MAYEDEIATAQDLLAEFGGDITYIATKAGAPTDATKPWRGAANDDTTTANVKAAFFPVNKDTQRGTVLDNRRLLANELAYIAAADLPGVTPTAGDRIDRSGQTYNVVEVDYLNVNGEAILYTVYLEA